MRELFNPSQAMFYSLDSNKLEILLFGDLCFFLSGSNQIFIAQYPSNFVTFVK